MNPKVIFCQALIGAALLTSCGGSTSSSDNGETSSDKGEVTAESITTESRKAKLSIFNDIGKTRQALSENGIGRLGAWKYSEAFNDYYSLTDYFEFGEKMPRNNLAYYLESESYSYIQIAKLVLNINNENEAKQAFLKFKGLVKKTFESLSLEMPKGLNDAIDKEVEFEAANDSFSTSLELEKSNIDTWKLIIATK